MEVNGDVEMTRGNKDRFETQQSVELQQEEETKESRVTILPAQVLDKYINFIPTVAFSANLQASWESMAVGFSAGLLNGGPTSLVYGTLFCWAGNLACTASLAEMASINPTVGAQYRWSGLYAPPGLMSPAFWGLIQGWITVFTWIATVAQPAFIVGTVLQGLIALNDDAYVPQRWHGTFLAWGLLAIPLFCNIFARKALSPLEVVGGVTHISFFIVWIVVLVTMAPRSTAEYVFATTYSGASFGGWPNTGVSWCVGLLSSVFPLGASDGVIHMSDEVKDAARKIPKSMVLSVLINGVMAWVMTIVLLFCIGDPVKALTTPTGYPVIEILYNATRSKVGTSVLMGMLSFNGVVAMFSSLASVSRLTWAFARDRGLPFPKFFGSVHPQLRIPLNSLLLVAALVMLLQLINIGSTSALFAILSLATLSLYVSYFIPILFFLLHKMRGNPIAYGPFRLGKWGYAINIFSLCFCVFIIIWLPFPPLLPVTAVNMNYAGPVFGAILIWALSDWFLWGRKRFVVPTKRSVFSE